MRNLLRRLLARFLVEAPYGVNEIRLAMQDLQNEILGQNAFD